MNLDYFRVGLWFSAYTTKGVSMKERIISLYFIKNLKLLLYERKKNQTKS